MFVVMCFVVVIVDVWIVVIVVTYFCDDGYSGAGFLQE